MNRICGAVGAAIVVALMLGLSACGRSNGADSPPAKAITQAQPAPSTNTPSVPVEREPDGMPRRYSVVPYGYNYTDFYIDSFEVNGAGGGNLEVGDWEGGGGEIHMLHDAGFRATDRIRVHGEMDP